MIPDVRANFTVGESNGQVRWQALGYKDHQGQFHYFLWQLGLISSKKPHPTRIQGFG
jgi:hypothetical protein